MTADTGLAIVGDIRKYRPQHESDLLQAISQDPDWHAFTNEKTIKAYRAALKNSITYVCYRGSDFCGFIRAIRDEGLAVYISELYVLAEYRNQRIGLSLIERVRNDCHDLNVYVLSDEDAYYRKKGYKKVGSVFKVD